MRTPNKSRSRNNKNRRSNGQNPGNVVNRVFDSSGPDGRVRGTPNQIIEKYEAHARDALLSGDRVIAENFSQHAEHYIRLLSEAKALIAKEQAAKQAEEDARRKEREEREAEKAAARAEAAAEVEAAEAETDEAEEGEPEIVAFESADEVPSFLK